MDIGHCNSGFLISFSEDNPCRLTLFLLILSTYKRRPSQIAIGRYCVQLTIQAMNRLNEKNKEQPQITPVWAISTTLLLPSEEKQGLIRNISGNSTERTTNVSHLIQYFIQLCQHKIYFTHTLLIAQMQIQRECPLFIREFSN